MKVKDLIKKLKRAPDDAVVVTAARDHSYRKVGLATVVPAENHGDDEYSEYYDKANMSGGTLEDVFLIN